MLDESSLTPEGFPRQAAADHPARIGRPRTDVVLVEPDHYILQIQEVGQGYEAVIHSINAEKLAEMAERARSSSRKERGEGEQSAQDVIRAARRAKQKVRWLVKWIGADRMLTFTSRDKLATLDEAVAAWDKFRRSWRKLVPDEDWGYVLAAERHKSGFYHLHVAVSGYFPLKQAHRLWQIALGGNGGEKGAGCLGTIDLARTAKGKDAPWRIAAYISKYMTKEFADPSMLNRKRFWASRHDLPQVRRLWLNGRTLFEATTEAVQRLAVDVSACVRHGQFCLSEDRGFAWWYWCPDWGSPDDAPF